MRKAAMKNIIAGTAGHIDHGKTSLVRALTGIDTDRLAEEKRRGITIDLGFAHLQVSPSLRIGFVDVPGHERFVKNMLAGASGIDLVLFVVAADESIKPQTREHFDICRLLQISSGVIALTKTDVADPDIAELTRMEVEEMVTGSFLANAPIINVSAITGKGLPELRKALNEAALAVTQKNAEGYLRLPIDRVFSMKGFGTVVTGTLISGSVAAEDQVELHPQRRLLRVRGVQVHNASGVRATAGQRTALNLADIEPGELARGIVLAEPGLFESARSFDCLLQLLSGVKPLRHGAPVHFHAGTAEIEAEVRLFNSRKLVLPGEEEFVRILLREPTLLLPGDRFIIRQASPVVTIGGGAVVEVNGRKYRGGELASKRLGVVAQRNAELTIALYARESPNGISVQELIQRTGFQAALVERSRSQSELVVLDEGRWIFDRSLIEKLGRGLLDAVRKFHTSHPLQPGISRAELKAAVAPAITSAGFDAALVRATALLEESGVIRLRTHKVVMQEEESEASRRMEEAFSQAGLSVPSTADVLGASGLEPSRARNVLQLLLREKRLVKISEDLVFHASAIHYLKETLISRKGSLVGIPEFKTLFGLSRKYAIPLLEFLDRERITRREGEARKVL
jgi:selenocysteine-specific elongation factor